MKLYTIPVIFFLLVGTLVSGQTRKQKKADKYFEKYSYSKAIDWYEEIDEKTTQINRNLAESYLKTGATQMAEEYYSIIAKDTARLAEDVYNYSSILSMNGKYEDAEKWMKDYHALSFQDSRPVKHMESPNFYKELMVDKGRFSIKNLEVNSSQEDFGPSYFKDKIVFASSREGIAAVRRVWNWNGLPFLDMYVADKSADRQLSSLQQFFPEQNKKYHEGPVAFNKAGDYMVFTRNNYEGKTKDGVVKLKLYVSSFVEGEWQEPTPVHFNSDEYSVGHATLTADGNTMYFASDMPGGEGGVDLYKVEKLGEKWGTPKNLGKTVNTEGNEMFPFVHTTENMLFFSSDGHLGLGGLDVFMTRITQNGYSKVENVGVPVNGTMDDFSFILDSGMTSGYFASNRIEGKGDDDLYSFELLKPFTTCNEIKGIATDTKGNVLPEAEVSLYNAEKEVVETTVVGEDGAFNFCVEPGSYELKGTKDKYFDGNNSVTAEEGADPIEANVVLEKDPGLSLYTLVTEKEGGAPIEDVKITLMDNMTGTSESIVTPATGDFRKPITNKKLNDRISYNLKLEKEGYLAKTVTYNQELTREGQYNVHEALDLSLDKIEVGMDLGKIIDIKPIYFDYNKFNIREDAAVELEKIITVMTDNPAMVIELGSHTDCRGSSAYNERLSDKRAKASAKYIKSKITNPERISGKGYGENALSEDCGGNCKSCSDEQHQLNRRTEFKIIKM